LDVDVLVTAAMGRVLALFQTLPGVFVSVGRAGDGPSSIFVLEHPTREQRIWQHPFPAFFAGREGGLSLGRGVSVTPRGWLVIDGRASMKGKDASFIAAEGSAYPFRVQVQRWEVWEL
jgi:hypothetical protein